MNTRTGLPAPKPISPESHQAVVSRLFSPKKSTAIRSWAENLESVADKIEATHSLKKKQRVGQEAAPPQSNRIFNLDAAAITIGNEWCRLNTRDEPFSCVFHEIERAFISTTYFQGKQYRIVLPLSSISHLDLTIPASSDSSPTSFSDELEFPTELTIHLSGSPIFFIRSAGPFEKHTASSSMDSQGWIRSDDFTNVTGSRLKAGSMMQHRISLSVSGERQGERTRELVQLTRRVTGYLMELENWFMPQFDSRSSPIVYSSPSHSEHSVNTTQHSSSESTASSRRYSQFSFGSSSPSRYSHTVLHTPSPHQSSASPEYRTTEPIAAGQGLGLIVEGSHFQFPSTPFRADRPHDDTPAPLHPPISLGENLTGKRFSARRLEDVFEENLHTRRVRATTLDSFAPPPLVPFDLLPPFELDLSSTSRRTFKKEKIGDLKSSYDRHRSPSSWLPLPN